MILQGKAPSHRPVLPPLNSSSAILLACRSPDACRRNTEVTSTIIPTQELFSFTLNEAAAVSKGRKAPSPQFSHFSKDSDRIPGVSILVLASVGGSVFAAMLSVQAPLILTSCFRGSAEARTSLRIPASCLYS